MSDPTPGELDPVGAADHVLGAAEPELTLIEYGDFGCPYCFAASRPVRSLLDRYPAVRLVWRHLPDSELHPGADLAAELSEFASDGGKFWQAHSLLLAGRASFSTKDLLSVARQLDLDPAEAEAALRERRYCERVLDGRRRRRSGGRPRDPDLLRRRRAPRGKLAPAGPARPRDARPRVTGAMVGAWTTPACVAESRNWSPKSSSCSRPARARALTLSATLAWPS